MYDLNPETKMSNPVELNIEGLLRRRKEAGCDLIRRGLLFIFNNFTS
jgi:hypothetical protein